MKSYGVTFQIKPLKQYFHMELFLTLNPADEILWCDPSNEIWQSLRIALFGFQYFVHVKLRFLESYSIALYKTAYHVTPMGSSKGMTVLFLYSLHTSQEGCASLSVLRPPPPSPRPSSEGHCLKVAHFFLKEAKLSKAICFSTSMERLTNWVYICSIRMVFRSLQLYIKCLAIKTNWCRSKLDILSIKPRKRAGEKAVMFVRSRFSEVHCEHYSKKSGSIYNPKRDA